MRPDITSNQPSQPENPQSVIARFKQLTLNPPVGDLERENFSHNEWRTRIERLYSMPTDLDRSRARRYPAREDEYLKGDITPDLEEAFSTDGTTGLKVRFLQEVFGNPRLNEYVAQFPQYLQGVFAFE